MDYLDQKVEGKGKGRTASGQGEVVDVDASQGDVDGSTLPSSSSSSTGTEEEKADTEEEKADRSGKGEEEKAAESEQMSSEAAKGKKRLDIETENEELRRTLAHLGERVEELEKAKSEHDQGQEVLQALALSNLETARRLIEERADVNAREPTLRAHILIRHRTNCCRCFCDCCC